MARWRTTTGLVVAGTCLAFSACSSAAPVAPSAPTASGPSPSVVSVLASAVPSAPVVPSPVASPVSEPSPVGSPAALTPLRLSYVSVTGGVLPLWVTQDAGIFQKNGLDVTAANQSTSSSSTVAALLAGQLDVVWGDGMAAASADAQGADLVVIGTVHPLQGYTLEVAPSIQTPNDLKGTKLGVSSLAGTDTDALKGALTRMGLDWQTDVTLISLNDNASRIAGLQSGAVQGILQEPPGTLQLEAMGFRPLADLSTMDIPTLSESLMVQRSYLDAHRDTLQQLVDSLVEGTALMRSDRAYAVAELKKYFQSDDDAAMQATYELDLRVIAPLAVPAARDLHGADRGGSRPGAAASVGGRERPCGPVVRPERGGPQAGPGLIRPGSSSEEGASHQYNSPRQTRPA